MSKPVAVIILNWNGAKLLKEFLPEVDRYTRRDIADLIVVDNGSVDNSVDTLRGDFPGVRLIRFDSNLGYAAGYNRAIELTRYKYTVLLNSDVAVKDDWLGPLYDFMESNPEVVACQPKIKSYREPDKFEYAGAAGGFIDRHGFPFCRGRIFGSVEVDAGQYDETTDVDWASGAALMVRSDSYLDVGGLDARFFAHMEEIDLCWRLRLRGGRICAVGGSEVYHLGGGSLPASNPRKTFLNFRNNLLMLQKNLPVAVCRRALTVRRLLDTIAMAKMVVTFDFRNAAAVFRAHREFAGMRRDFMTTGVKENLIECRPDILVSYYICRTRRFSDLKAI